MQKEAFMQKSDNLYDAVAKTFRSFADTVGIIRRKRWQPLLRAMQDMRDGFEGLRTVTARLHEVVMERVRLNDALRARHQHNVVDVYARAEMFRKGGAK
jgi:hypothetical protein